MLIKLSTVLFFFAIALLLGDSYMVYTDNPDQRLRLLLFYPAITCFFAGYALDKRGF